MNGVQFVSLFLERGILWRDLGICNFCIVLLRRCQEHHSFHQHVSNCFVTGPIWPFLPSLVEFFRAEMIPVLTVLLNFVMIINI